MVKTQISSMHKTRYCPILLTSQMHTDYTVSAHDILILEKCSVVFVRCTENNQQVDVFIVLSVAYMWTVISQWSKVQVSNLLVLWSSLLRSRYFLRTFLNTAHTYSSYSTTLLIGWFMFLYVFWFCITKCVRLYRVY